LPHLKGRSMILDQDLGPPRLVPCWVRMGQYLQLEQPVSIRLSMQPNKPRLRTA
jgi:hypothetical protein